jgi:hypothetical protein
MITDPVIIDPHRSVSLAYTDFLAAMVVDADGAEHLMLVRSADVGRAVLHRYDIGCFAVGHEQLGQLPPEYLNRIAKETP